MSTPLDRGLFRAVVICVALAVGIVAIFFVVGCSHALNVGVVSSGVVDLHSTRVAIQAGGQEANPVMGQSAIRQAVLKAVGISGVIAIAGVLESKQHPIIAHLVRGAAIAVWSGVALQNYQRAKEWR